MYVIDAVYCVLGVARWVLGWLASVGAGDGL